jgi:hypothetical protein
MHKCIKHNEMASYKTVQEYIETSIPLQCPYARNIQCPTIADQVSNYIDGAGSKINRGMI